MRSMIAVGVTDTPAARAALRWALRHAARTDRGVELLHVVAARASAADREAGSRLLAEALGIASRGAPAVTATVRLLHGDVVQQILGASSMAGLLVLGSSGGDAVGRGIRRTVLTGARCPTVLVPAADRLFPHGFVVGADRSPSGLAALAFAASEAAASGQRLTLVRSWFFEGQVDDSRRSAVLGEAARRAADAVLAELQDAVRTRHHDVLVDIRSVHGPLVEVLGEASVHADLLVLGATSGRAPAAVLPVGGTPVAIVHGHETEPVADAPWDDAVSEGWSDLGERRRATGFGSAAISA